MRGYTNAALWGLLIAMGATSSIACAQTVNVQTPTPGTATSAAPSATTSAGDPAASVATPATPAKPSAATPEATTATDHTALGKALLNAGPDPRVRLDGLSRDHAAIFGTDDENEQALMDQERTLQTQRDQLQMLERLLNQKPAAADPHPPAMIPLNANAPMNMPKLAPTPSGSQLDRSNNDTRRSLDEMQRRVNGLRREADTLGQGGR